MHNTGYPRIYRSFDDFERSELRKLDQLQHSVGEMVDQLLMAELEEDTGRESEDGILFDRIED